jgi:hypothetical protein
MFFQVIAEILVVLILAEVLCRIFMGQGLWRSFKGLFGDDAQVAIKEATERPSAEIVAARTEVEELDHQLRTATEELRLANVRGDLEEQIATKLHTVRSVRSKLARAKARGAADDSGSTPKDANGSSDISSPQA